MASQRGRILGEPLETLEPSGLFKKGLVALRLYADGFELEEKRPSVVRVARWQDVELFDVKATGKSVGLGVRLREGVLATRMERFNRRFEGSHFTVPFAFGDSQDDLHRLLQSYRERFGDPLRSTFG